MRVRVFSPLSRSRFASLSLYLAAVFMLLTFVTLQRFPVTPVSPLNTRLQELPLRIGTWQGTEGNMDQAVVNTLQLDDWMMRLYQQRPDTLIWLYIGYYADLPGFANHHSPQVCYPANGWELRERGFQQIEIPGSEPILVQRLVVQKDLEQRLVLYWHQAGEEVTTEQRPLRGRWSRVLKEYKLRFANTLQGTPVRSDRALVRVSAPVRGTLEATLAREIDFIQSAFPLLAKHFAPDVSSR